MDSVGLQHNSYKTAPSYIVTKAASRNPAAFAAYRRTLFSACRLMVRKQERSQSGEEPTFKVVFVELSDHMSETTMRISF